MSSSSRIAILSLFLFSACADDGELDVEREEATVSGPAETTYIAANGDRATFTKGAYTVRFTGPKRTFRESKNGITNTVVSDTWVRVLARPFAGSVDRKWADARIAENRGGVPDVLATAMEYLDGAPAVYDVMFLQIAGDAGYGSTQGADFNDYLGVTWTYPSGSKDAPEAADLRNLDCSGFVRMVFGYRSGVPMSIAPTAGATLPRSSWQILDSAPGVVTIPRNGNTQVTNLAALRPGDLVFFDATADSAAQIDHVGIFIGVDSAGHYRMINSRNTMGGPTMRDGAGSTYGESVSPSILDGGALYARSLRAARRL